MGTYEPLLYNVPILALCDKVLNHPCVTGPKTRATFEDLRVFCEAVVRHFAKLASGNSVLFVDALFLQPALQRVKFCETAHLHYCEPEQLLALKAQRHMESRGGYGGGGSGREAMDEDGYVRVEDDELLRDMRNGSTNVIGADDYSSPARRSVQTRASLSSAGKTDAAAAAGGYPAPIPLREEPPSA